MNDNNNGDSDDPEDLPRPPKPSKEFYRRNLPHIQKPGRPIFVTFRARHRIVLPESIRARVLQHCLHDHGRKIHVHCAVIMPDHVHILVTLLTDLDGNAYSLEEVTNGIKGASAHSVNRHMKRKGSLWLDESFDHILRSDQSVEAKTQYICDNPVRKGLVARPDDYPWLSREWIEGDSENRRVSENGERE